MTFKETLSKYKYYIIAVVVVLLLVGAYSAGRYGGPEKIVEKEKLVTVEKIVTVEVEKIVTVEKKVYIKAQKNDVKTEVIVIERPDGTTETKTVIVDRTTTDTASSQETNKVEIREKIVYVDREKIVEKEKLVENAKPQWKLGVRVEGGAMILKPIQPIIGIGLTAERRIIGPFFMGIAVSTDLGVNATGFTGPYSVKGGITLGAEF